MGPWLKQNIPGFVDSLVSLQTLCLLSEKYSISIGIHRYLIYKQKHVQLEQMFQKGINLWSLYIGLLFKKVQIGE